MPRFTVSIFLIFLLAAAPAMAQATLSVTPRIGYGNFSMLGLKTVQQGFQQQNNLGLRATEEFPAYFQYGLEIRYKVSDRFKSGMVLETGSTGGRLSYADYSGWVRADQLVQYIAGGFFGEYELYNRGISLHAGTEVTAVSSSLSLTTALQVQEHHQTEATELVSFGVGAKPYFSLRYPVKRFIPAVSLGYQLYSGNPFHIRGDERMVLSAGGKEIGPHWGGARLTAGIGFMLF